MRKPAKEQQLTELESEFEPLLIKCLKECVLRRKGGLFETGQTPEIARYLRWDEAEKLRAMAIEIQQIRSEWGSSNKLAEKYLAYCAQRGANLPGEPKRAAIFLESLRTTK